MSALIVLAGQSNALVFNLTPADLPAYALTPDPHVQILVGGAFQTMVPGVNTGGPNTPSSWGPEVAFAHAWTAAHPGETLYLVKSAKGSTGLVAGAAPNWSPEQPPAADGSPNGMFNKTTALVDQAKALTGLPVSDVLWMQGEQDATDPLAAAAYRANLADLFAHMRSDWGADRIDFGQISDHAGLAYDDAIRAAQLAVAQGDPRTLLIDTEALADQADHLHLSAAGALALGEAFYLADALGGLLDHAHARFSGELFAGLM